MSLISQNNKVYKLSFGNVPVFACANIETVPHDDPRVAATNGNRGLVVKYESTGKREWVVTFESGKQCWYAVDGNIEDLIGHGIIIGVVPRMMNCIDAVYRGLDTSKYPDQMVFDAKVWLGRIIIE